MSSIRDLKKERIKEIEVELIKVNNTLTDKKFLMGLEYRDLGYIIEMLKSYEILKKRKK